MILIRKIGWWRFLRLFWAVFRRKYYPTESGLASDPSALQGSKDGSMFVLALLVGGALTITPVAVGLFAGPESVNYPAAITGFICGLFLLSVPIGAAISMMVEIDKRADELFDEMNRY